MLSFSIDIGYLVTFLSHKVTVWQAALGGGISDDDRSVYPFVFFHAEFGQITDYLRLLVQPSELIDPAASEIERVGGDHHILYRAGTVGYIVAVIPAIGDDDQDRRVVAEDISAFL